MSCFSSKEGMASLRISPTRNLYGKDYKKVLVAFSGGVDSALVLKVASDSLGVENVLAVTADSPSYPKEELDNAIKLAQEFGLNGRHLVIETDEVENPN